MSLFDYDPNGPPQNVLQGAPQSIQPTPFAPNAPQLPTDPSVDAYNNGGAKPGFLDRILNRIMPTSNAYRGLLSPDEVQESRRRGLLNFGTSMLAQSSGQNGGLPPGVGAALGNAVQSGVTGFDNSQKSILGEQQTAAQIAQQKHILAVRQQAQGMFAAPQGVQETQQQQLDRQSALGAYLASNGDYEGAKGISEATAPLRMARAYGAMGAAGQIKDTSSGMYRIDPATGQATPLTGPDGKQLTSNAVTEDDRAQQRQFNQLSLSERQQQHEDGLDSRAVQQFQTRNGDGLKMVQNLGQVSSLLDQADKGNTYATQALPGALAGVLDPKSRVGPSILAKVSTYDPSIIGRIQQYAAAGWQGTIPPNDLATIRRALQATYNERSAGLKKDWAGVTKVRPGAANQFSLDGALGDNSLAAASGGQAAPAGQPAPAAGPAAQPAVNPYR